MEPKSKIIDQLQVAYNDVFNTDGSVKACGRSVCTQLIFILKCLGYSDVGNVITGVMDVNEIKIAYNDYIKK